MAAASDSHLRDNRQDIPLTCNANGQVVHIRASVTKQHTRPKGSDAQRLKIVKVTGDLAGGMVAYHPAND